MHSRVEDESGDVLLRHPGQLVREDTLESEHPEEVLAGGRVSEGVMEDLEGDDSFPLLLLWAVVTGYLVVEESRLGEGGNVRCACSSIMTPVSLRPAHYILNAHGRILCSIRYMYVQERANEKMAGGAVGAAGVQDIGSMPYYIRMYHHSN